jgi:YihY family inner membrane protein
MSKVHAGLQKLNRVQQSHSVTAFGVAVVKKFGEDRGGMLAALITYYGFVSLFPLLLLLVTILGLIAGGDPSLTHSLEKSALSQFPVVGDKLGSNLHQLQKRSAVGLVVGILGLLWGSLGVVQSFQFAMAEVWNVPGPSRPSYLKRLAKTLATLGSLGVFLLVSTALAGVAAFDSGVWLDASGAIALSLLLNIALFTVAFRLLTPGQIAWSSLLPGAIVGGAGWSLLQYVGSALVDHTLRNTSQIYGVFAVVLGLLAWIFLGAQLTVYAAEINVVRARHLWPRSLVQPPFTVADRRVLSDLVLEAQRRPEQQVVAGFRPDVTTGNPGSNDDPGSGPSG